MDLDDLAFAWVNAFIAGRTLADFTHLIRESFGFFPAQVAFQSEQAQFLLWRHLHPGF
jgi:hypothetical protein